MSKFPGAGLVGDMWVAACMSCSTLSVLAIECVSLILTNTHPPPPPPPKSSHSYIHTHLYRAGTGKFRHAGGELPYQNFSSGWVVGVGYVCVAACLRLCVCMFARMSEDALSIVPTPPAPPGEGIAPPANATEEEEKAVEAATAASPANRRGDWSC